MIITVGDRAFEVIQSGATEWQAIENGGNHVSGYVVDTGKRTARFNVTNDENNDGDWAHTLEGAVRELAKSTRMVEATDTGRRIAASWQSSGTAGSILAQFATTGTARLDKLADDARRTRDAEGRTGTVNYAMDALMTDGYEH